MSNIVEDFRRGKNAEDKVARIFSSHGYSITRVYKNPEFDFIITAGEFYRKIEVKRDDKATRTRLLAIEFANSRRKETSGIEKTTSDIIVYVIQDKVFAAKTGELKEYIETVRPQEIRVDIGDGNSSILLYPLHTTLYDVFTEITNITTKDLKEFLEYE